MTCVTTRSVPPVMIRTTTAQMIMALVLFPKKIN
jgi:hypothetical protein